MRKLLTALGGLLALVAATAAPRTATAGCCLIVSLHPLPELVAGEQATVSFTVLVPGNPGAVVHLGGAIGYEVRVRGPGGEHAFAASATTRAGQFAATIAVPAHTSEVELVVAPPDGPPLQEWIAVRVIPPAEAMGGVDWLPFGFGAMSLAGLGLVLSDGRSHRRAPPAVAEDVEAKSGELIRV